ncbi:uncharacterized protein V6R79_010022 [Siganus canaliculatus]
MNSKDEQSYENREEAAKLQALMLKTSTKSNLNLYDHLTQLLERVIDEEPLNAVDVIEDLSYDVKRRIFKDTQSTLRDSPDTTETELLAEQQRLLFSKQEESDQEEELGKPNLPNVTEIGFYLEQAGVGLGREEMQRIFLSLRQLVESQGLLHCRLWGKILGLKRNYIVAEAEYRDVEEEEEQNSQREKREAERNNRADSLPRSTYEPPPPVPNEALGTGANKFLYYVCSEPGLPWSKLPPVTPAQITVARQIRKFFTGSLDSPIVSYPPFPGNEANYLRAQIARISAGTQVSPVGFYQTGEEEGDEADEAPRDSCEENLAFTGLSATVMSESLSTWVHHIPHILKQGRCTWVNLTVKPEEDSYEEDEDEEREEKPVVSEPEDGPPLLTPLSHDEELFNTPPWTLGISSSFTTKHAVAVVRSNLWPGACAYSCGTKFENIYVGWGLKYAGEGHNPTIPPLPQKEYPSGPDITEVLDPSVEEEEALKGQQEELDEQNEEDEDEEEEDEDEEDD